MPTEKPRFMITISGELLQEIEDYRFENRFPNRTRAVAELIRLGLEAVKRQKEEQKEEK